MQKADLVLCGKAFNGMGFCYYYFYHDIPNAHDALLMAANLCKRTGDLETESMACFNLAGVYSYGNLTETHNSQKVVDFLSQSYDYALASNNWDMLLNSISNISYKADYKNCPEKFKKRIDSFLMLKIPDSIPNRDYYIFNAQMAKYKIEGNYQGVISKAQDQLSDLDNLLDKRNIRLNIFNELSKAYLKLGQLDSAYTYINKVITSCEKGGGLTGLHPFYKTLGDIYYAQGKDDLAKEAMLRYYQLKDSVVSHNSLLIADNLDFMSSLKHRNREYVYREQKHQLHLQIAVSLALLLLIAIPMIIRLYQQNKTLQERNLQLYDNQQLRIREWLEEKERANRPPQTPSGHYRALDGTTAEGMKNRIIAIMDTSNEIYSADFSLDRLAELAGSKPRVVSSILNDCLNKTFHELLNEYRVREACRRLSDEEHYGHLTIEAISSSLGYKSRTTLLNAFKKQTGLTPTEYQRISRKQTKDVNKE